MTKSRKRKSRKPILTKAMKAQAKKLGVKLTVAKKSKKGKTIRRYKSVKVLKRQIANAKKKSRKPKKKSRKSKSKFNMKSLKEIAASNVDAETFAGLHVPTYSQSYLRNAPKRVHPVAGALAGQIMEARPKVSSGALQSKKLNTVLSRMLTVRGRGPSFHELGRADHYGSDLVESIKEMIRLGAAHGWLPVVFPPDLPMPKLGDERVGCKNKDVLTMEPFGVDDQVVRLNILNAAGMPPSPDEIDYWCLSKDFIKHYCSQAMIDNPPYCEWVGPPDMDDSGHGGRCGNLKLLQIPSRGGETWMITVNLGRQLLKAANSRGSLEVSVKRIKQVAVGATHNQAGGASTSHGNTRHWVWGCRGSCKQVQFSRAILEGSCEHMIMKTLNDRNIFPDSLRRAGEWSVLAKDAWKMSAVLRAECFLKEILDDDSLQNNSKLLNLYRKMVSYEINNNPRMQVGDWVWVYPNNDRQNYSLGRISVKETTPKEYEKIKLFPDVNVKTLKRLGIKPIIKTIITDEGDNPARYFPAFVREALIAKGNPIMIRSLQPMARPDRGSMSYEAMLSILGSHD